MKKFTDIKIGSIFEYKCEMYVKVSDNEYRKFLHFDRSLIQANDNMNVEEIRHAVC
jgi:hypothetical protein